MATRVRPVSEVTASAAKPGRTSGRSATRPAPTGNATASVQGLTKRFGGRVVLDDLSLDIGAGEFVAMIGRSGSGKSTLLRVLAGLDKDVSGSLTVDGPVAVAFQEPRLVPWKRVIGNVTLGLRDPDPAKVAEAALGEVGLADRAAAWPLTLSGGEAQRVSLARALVRSPSLLLLDEPFSALDALTRMAMHRLVMGLWERHRPAVLLVTHDVDEALALADRVLVLGEGQIACSADIDVPRPRQRDHPELTALRLRLLRELGVPTESVDLPTDPHPFLTAWRLPDNSNQKRRTRMQLRRKLLILPVLALTGLAAAACSSSGGSSSAPASSSASASSSVNLSSVTLRVGDQKGTGEQALLTAAGLLNSFPFKVTFSDFTSGPPILEAMSAGAVDIGGVGDAPPVFEAAGGGNVEIVQATKNIHGDSNTLLVPKNSPITSVAQLKGKKIAISEGSSDDYNLLTVLDSANLTSKDVTIVNLQPAAAIAAFSSGAVDAWDVWAPYVQQAEAQDNARVLTSGAAYGDPYNFVVASKSALADPSKAAAIKIYLQTLNKAYVWETTHLSTWAKIWGEAAGLPTSIMNPAAAAADAIPVPVSATVIAAENAMATQFYKLGQIPTDVNMSDYSTTQFNSVVPSS